MASKYVAAVELTRALARVVKVNAIEPIKKADRIELARIDGWQCVVKKGEFTVDQLAIYVEIDSLLPVTEPVFAFLAERKESLKTFDDVVYSRIRSIKLRGELSQGLLIPLPESLKNEPEGTNLTNRLNVRKWDEVILNSDGLDARLNAESKNFLDRVIKKIAGKAAKSQFSPWPSQLSRSDQQRLQNIGNHYTAAAVEGELFEESVKLDGQSMTVYTLGNKVGVCSRNYDLSLEDIVFTPVEIIRRFIASNLFALVSGLRSIPRTFSFIKASVKEGELKLLDGIKTLISKKYFYFSSFQTKISARNEAPVAFALDNDIPKRLLDYNTKNNDTITIQGELIGPGIQSNAEGVENNQFYIYQVYRNGNQWVSPTEAEAIAISLGLNYIPVANRATTLPISAKEVLERANGAGTFDSERKREGIVFKSLTRDFSFKVISTEYLLEKEKKIDEMEKDEVSTY